MQRANVSLSAAKEMSVAAAVAEILLELDDILALEEEQRTALKTCLNRKMFSFYS